MVKGKKILLCVTGGVAVYKSAALTSKLVQAGAHVKVIMSSSARQFVTPLTFQALSRNEVYTDTFDEKNPEVIAHIDLADWADLVLVAPATANVIGKLANGIGDDMVTTTLLAATAPVWIAPAMNVHMYGHPAVQKNIAELHSFGYRFIEPSEGYLACGYVGKGRLQEPEKIVEHIDAFFKERASILSGKKIVITAGPTREKIDPVRFFSNRSSGKMGFALAEEAVKLGAEVTLVSGPVSLQAPHGVKLISVESAEEMYNEVLNVYRTADIVIKSAAVADYRPKVTADKKMKKQPGDLSIEFERTKDILRTLGDKKDGQLLVGFAAETNDIEKYAAEKLRKKNADIIIANNITVEGAGFAGDTNIVTVFRKDGTKRELPLLTKTDTAKEILNEIKDMMDKG
ncbi:MAG: bifunctional phosphopantothenoylcysteine decarboxylase/phosphopantothenate--cysteine ligase CoaBC [Bacillota bacterium]